MILAPRVALLLLELASLLVFPCPSLRIVIIMTGEKRILKNYRRWVVLKLSCRASYDHNCVLESSASEVEEETRERAQL